VEQYDEGVSEDSRRVDIDGLEEARCATLVQSARYLEGIRRYHDHNVKEHSFNVGDLVLCRIQNTEGLHKLSSPWEGPFSCKGDWTGLLPPPDARRRRCQQLVEHRPTLSILHLVYTTTPGAPFYTTTQDPLTVSGLRVQAPVSKLLHSMIQPTWLLTDRRLQRATKDSRSSLLRDHVLLDPAYTATNGSTAVSGYTPSTT
jgi:hypothetical protein